MNFILSRDTSSTLRTAIAEIDHEPGPSTRDLVLLRQLLNDRLELLEGEAQHRIADYQTIWDEVIFRFRCDLDSIHGPAHWKRVERNALMIASRNGADIDVVRLFAVLHDSCRLNDYSDPEHGIRAAEYAKQMRGKLYRIKDARFDILYQACKWHAHGHTSMDPTIGACWDADRLDLGRVRVIPDASFFSTQARSFAATLLALPL